MTIHAEIAVLNKIHNIKNINKCTIVIIRTNKSGELLNSIPCTNCLYHIKKLGIKKIIYSNNNILIKDKIKNIIPTSSSIELSICKTIEYLDSYTWS